MSNNDTTTHLVMTGVISIITGVTAVTSMMTGVTGRMTEGDWYADRCDW